MTSSPEKAATRSDRAKNADSATVAGFGDEWSRFDQSALSEAEKARIFQEYFGIFNWGDLPSDAVGIDFGCGSGRWATVVAPRVGHLYCVDASADALEVAKRNLTGTVNTSFILASVAEVPLPDESADFAYSLGVLHHIPDTLGGIRSCVEKLKIGSPFLVYLYYRFDNRPGWFAILWRASDLLRRAVSRLPYGLRYVMSQLVAIAVYLPLAKTAGLFEKAGADVSALPLAYYRDKSFYTMRTDSLDRLGTQLEQRFTRSEIQAMMESAGLDAVRFSDSAPYWCAVGTRRA